MFKEYDQTCLRRDFVAILISLVGPMNKVNDTKCKVMFLALMWLNYGGTLLQGGHTLDYTHWYRLNDIRV